MGSRFLKNADYCSPTLLPPIATTLTAHSSAISAQRIAVRVIVKAEISNNKT